MTVTGTCFPTGFSAFNDSALSRVPGHGPAALAVEVEDEVFARYTADALVIATPTGSTAYSFAAGGPIVSPRHRGLLVTPVAPHAAFDRAVFLHPDESLRVHVLDRSAPLLLEADGQRVAELNAGRLHRVRDRATRPAQILRLQPQGFYERARRKLQLTDSSELAPAVNRRGRERRGRPAPRPSSARPRTRWPRCRRSARARRRARCCSTAARRGRSTCADPRRLGFAYMRRIADLIDAFRPAGSGDRRAARRRRRVRAAALRGGDAAALAPDRVGARPGRRGAGARAPRAAGVAAAAGQGRRRGRADPARGPTAPRTS